MRTTTTTTHIYQCKLFPQFDELIVLPSDYKNASGTILFTGLSRDIPEGSLIIIPHDNDTVSICYKNHSMGLGQDSSRRIIPLLPPVNEPTTDRALIETLCIQSGLFHSNLNEFLSEYYELNLSKPLYQLIPCEDSRSMRRKNAEKPWELKATNTADVDKLIQTPGTTEYQIAQVFELLRKNTKDFLGPHSLVDLLYDEVRFYYYAGLYKKCQSILNQIFPKITAPAQPYHEISTYMHAEFYYVQAVILLATYDIDDARESFKAFAKYHAEFHQDKQVPPEAEMTLKHLEEEIAMRESETLSFKFRVFENDTRRFVEDLSTSVSHIFGFGSKSK